MRYQLKHYDDDLAQPQPSVQQPPPSGEDEQLRQIVEVLLAGYATEKAAELLAKLMPGIEIRVWKLALDMTRGKVKANARIAGHELRSAPARKIARGAAHSETYYRAAYVARAAERMQTDVNDGTPVSNALRNEVKVYKTHQAARNNRLNAASRTARAAENFGDLLGWYLNPLLNNEPECIAANGNNFRASQGTVIGFPGSVHLNCGCTAGPPIVGAGMVNDAIAAAHDVIFQTPRRYGLKAVS